MAQSILFLVLDRLSAEAKEALRLARVEATRSGHAQLLPAHLLLGLLQADENGEDGSAVTQLLAHNGVSRNEMTLYAQAALPPVKAPTTDSDPPFSPTARRALNNASGEASRMNRQDICPEHLLLGLLRPCEDPLDEVLRSLPIDFAQTRALAERLGQHVGYPFGPPLECLGSAALAVLDLAHQCAKRTHCSRIGTQHLLLALLEEPTRLAESIAIVYGLEPEQLRERARAACVSDGKFATAEKRFTPAVRRALWQARRRAVENRHRWIGVDDLFHGLLPAEEPWSETLMVGLRLRSAPEDPGGDILCEALANVPPDTVLEDLVSRGRRNHKHGFRRLLWSGAAGWLANLGFMVQSPDRPAPAHLIPALMICFFVWGFIGYLEGDKRQSKKRQA